MNYPVPGYRTTVRLRSEKGYPEPFNSAVGRPRAGDTAFYPDDDLVWFYTEDGKRAVHWDGNPCD